MYYHTRKTTIKKTALYFGVSAGLVSENIQLANRINVLGHLPTREKALAQLRK